MSLSPEQCEKSLEVLKQHRHELVAALPKPAPDANLVPFLKASLTVTAIDVAISALEHVKRRKVVTIKPTGACWLCTWREAKP